MFKYIIILMILSLSMSLVNAGVNDDLVFYANFDENINDSSTNELNTQAVNPTYTTGQIGEALINVADITYFQILDDDTLTFQEGTNDKAFTIAFWSDINSTSEGLLTKGWEISSASEYVIFIYNGEINIRHYSDSSFIRFDTDDTLQNLKVEGFNHFVFTYNGDVMSPSMKIYLNGNNLDGEMYYGTYDGTHNTDKNVYWSNLAGRFGSTHSLDELRLYDIEYSQALVTELYEYTGESEETEEGICASVMLMNKYGRMCNFTLYEDNNYIGEYQYTDVLIMNNSSTYSLVLHEDILDGISDIENIDDLATDNITFIMYIIIALGVLTILNKFMRKK